MATETDYKKGRCAQHGEVEASRELPAVTFPWVINAARRSIAAKRTAFACPRCGKPVDAR